ncbi:hypothetical protein, partial [Clostridium grantii]
AKILAREKYNLTFEQVKRRLFNGTDYYFDSATRLYKHKAKASDTAEFMSLEELDNQIPARTVKNRINASTEASPNLHFDEMVKDLIKDRIMELNKYVSIDHSSRCFIVKANNLKIDGYNLVVI